MTEFDKDFSEAAQGTSSNANDDTTNSSHQQEAPTESETARKAPKSIYGGWEITVSFFIAWAIILVVFKFIYDRYQKKARANKKRWFKTHPEKEAYEALLASKPDDEDGLRKALLRRAMTDVKRIVQMQEEKDSLFKLMRAGAVPETIWNDFKDSEQEMQLEMFDLQAEAETFKPGWGQAILTEAAQLVQRERELTMMKARMEASNIASSAAVPSSKNN